MLRNFNLVIILFCLSSLICKGQQSKKDALVNILQLSNKVEDINTIIPVLKKYPDLYNSIPLGKPIKVDYVISSPFGNRYHPIDKVYKFHSGIDLVSDYATTIHATADGTVIFAGRKGGYGKCVIIEHQFGYSTIYAHLTLYYTKKGSKVTKASVIGFLGNTGKSTADHLHYEIKKNNKSINPYLWMD